MKKHEEISHKLYLKYTVAVPDYTSTELRQPSEKVLNSIVETGA